jgi:hypothetical protein
MSMPRTATTSTVLETIITVGGLAGVLPPGVFVG